MISSVSVERACVRHVSHTSSVTFTPRNAILLPLATLPAAAAAAATATPSYASFASSKNDTN
jgi:hypothetical protein